MGCDIHMVVERKMEDSDGNAVWVGVWSPAELGPQFPARRGILYACDDRDYNFFASIAGVRGHGPEPMGVPDDASELARLLIESYGLDGHSHSWLPLETFVFRKWMQLDPAAAGAAALSDDLTAKVYAVLRAEHTAYHNLEDYRVVFWFDN